MPETQSVKNQPGHSPFTNSHSSRTPFFRLKRRYAQRFAEAGLEHTAQKLLWCEETEVLIACSACTHHWWATFHCGLRVCPLCSYKIARERAKWLRDITAHMKHPKMLTLTFPRWKDDPKVGVAFLRDAFSKLRRNKVFSQVTGGAYLIEVKPKPDGWHIHLHCMFDGPYLPRQLVFTVWRKLVKCNAPDIDIRSPSSDDAKSYIAKDSSKAVSFDCHPDDIVRWFDATKGIKLWGTFGTWFNSKIVPSPAHFHDLVEPKPCPQCGSTCTAFYARDGPRIFGAADWLNVQSDFTDGGPTTRPIPVMENLLGTSDLQRVYWMNEED